MTRILHFSDVHLTARPLGFRVRDAVGKRSLGYANLMLTGRAQRFRHAGQVADALLADVAATRPDGIAFSGDATALGFEAEFAHAARRLRVGDLSLPPAVAVPGNHDQYTRRVVRAGAFERHFGPWLDGERIDGATYPFARRVGDAWLIGVNSSEPHRFRWDASGRVGPEQLARLWRLCAALPPGPRVLVTHYPLRTAAGEIEPRGHRLLDHEEVLKSAIKCRVSLWLHGHIHAPFVLPASAAIPFPVVCAGSATQVKRFAHNVYDLDGGTVHMRRRVYSLATGRFEDSERVTLEMPHAEG